VAGTARTARRRRNGPAERLHSPVVGGNARAHLDRAIAHLCEAHIAINENKSVRAVQQLVDDLNCIQQLMDDAQRRKSQRI
jgi:hypothetical protein